jgi:hypothetical protein
MKERQGRIRVGTERKEGDGTGREGKGGKGREGKGGEARCVVLQTPISAQKNLQIEPCNRWDFKASDCL